MSMIINGFRNVYRGKLRTIIVILMISFPFFTFLMMSSIGDAVDSQVNLIKGANTIIRVRPQGSYGHINMAWNQNKLLPEGTVEKIEGIDHIAKIESYLAAMEPIEDYYMIMHIGVEPGDKKRLESHGEVGDPTIIAGRDFTERDKGKYVAIIGKLYAENFGITPENLDNETYFTREELKPGGGLIRKDISVADMVKEGELKPGSGLTEKGLRSLSGRQLKIIGVFSSGYVFGDNQLFMPLDISKEIYETEGLSWIYVTVDSTDNVESVSEKIREVLEDSADVITAKSGARFVSKAGGAIKMITNVWILLSMALMMSIILFTMAIVTRERVKEIGTLKAMGASNLDIARQFMAESLALTFMGGVLGVVIFKIIGSTIGQYFFTVTMVAYLPVQYGRTLFENLSVDYSISMVTVLSLVLVSFIVSLAGTAYPIIKSIKMSPVEAMRHE